jgi:hypothetical protein
MVTILLSIFLDAATPLTEPLTAQGITEDDANYFPVILASAYAFAKDNTRVTFAASDPGMKPLH